MAEELGLAYVRILPSMRGFSSEVSKELKGELDGPSEEAGKESGRRFGSGFSETVKTAMKAAVVAGTAAAGAFAVKAVQAASDLNESISKVNTVFGKSAGEIQAWSKTTASSLGLSRNEALGAVGAFGNMFDQLGIGAAASAKMSTGMVKLAADFASFHNADISEVLAAQQAAFRGEYDSLQKFLPLINAANVEQKAMAMTGKTSAKALTQQEKALAVNKLMMEGAGEAAGDFQRTSGGLANQMRILKAQAADFAANAGQVLIPIVLKGIQIFKDLAATIQAAVGPALETVGAVAKQVFDIIFRGDFTGGPFAEDSPFIGKVFEVRDALLGFGQTVKDLVSKIVGWWNGFTSSFSSDSDQAGTTANKLMGIIGQLRDLFMSAFGAIQATVVTAIDFLSGVWRVFGDDLIAFARETWANILETIRGALNVLTGIFDLIKAILTGRWGDAWQAVKKIVDGVWDTIFSVVRNAVTNVIPTIIAGLGQAVSSVARTAFDGLKDPLKAVLNWGIGLLEKFANATIAAFTAPIGVLNKIPGIKSVVPDIPKIDLPELDGGGRIGQTGIAVVHHGEEVFSADQLSALRKVINAVPSTYDGTGRATAPVIGGDLVLNAAEMRPADVSAELAWWSKVSGR